MSRRIYFDNAATTPILPEAIEAMSYTAKNIFGNPSSIHSEGRIAKSFLEESRKHLAHQFHAGVGEVFFTSCGTEANNSIIYQCASALGVKNIVTTSIEHPNVFVPIDDLHGSGKINRILLPVSKYGEIDLENLETILSMLEGKTLVSIMHIQNELGTIYPIKEIGELCKKYTCLFHSDTVQGIGFQQYDVQQLPIDFMSGSAHKFYGPKGIGFMFIRNTNMLPSFLRGGSQERNMRAGTENLIGISGMVTSLDWCYKNYDARIEHLSRLKNYLKEKLILAFPFIQMNSPLTSASEKILNVHFPEFNGSDLLPVMLDIEGIAVSGGSACSSGVEKASPVIGQIRPNDNGKAIRISFSHQNTIEECDILIESLQKILKNKI